MRLIDADTAKANVAKVFIGASKFAQDTRNAAYEAIDAAPTIEPPVVHGKWINQSEPNADNNVDAECSNCHAGDLQAVNAVVPYCWKCGAKMDKEDKPCT